MPRSPASVPGAASGMHVPTYCSTARRTAASAGTPIGRHGAPWTPETAREEARRLLGEVVKGGDPAADKKARRTAVTVAELCDLYMADVEAGRLLTRRSGRRRQARSRQTEVGLKRM